jgi:4-alpha-glucanotransferase
VRDPGKAITVLMYAKGNHAPLAAAGGAVVDQQRISPKGKATRHPAAEVTLRIALVAVKEQLDQPATMQRAREAAIRIAYASRAKFVILPLQDALGTGAESRMNCPGILSDRNWSWRVEENALTERLAKKLADMVAKANR